MKESFWPPQKSPKWSVCEYHGWKRFCDECGAESDVLVLVDQTMREPMLYDHCGNVMDKPRNLIDPDDRGALEVTVDQEGEFPSLERLKTGARYRSPNRCKSRGSSLQYL